MKTRMILLTMVICLAGKAAADTRISPFMGTWKLNLSKSKIIGPDGVQPVPLTKSIVIYEPVGSQVKVTDDDIFTDGHSLHMEWSGKFDAKDYPVTGDPTADTWSYKKVNDRTLIFASKKDGNIVAQRRVTVSLNGKARTLTGTRPDANGKKIRVVAVYDKE